MNTSKELTQMVKQIKIAIYYFNNLDLKTRDAKVKLNLLESKHVFENFLDFLIDNKLIESVNLSFMLRLLLRIKINTLDNDNLIKYKAYRLLEKGAYLGNQLLKNYHHIDDDFKSQIQSFIRQSFELMVQFETKVEEEDS